MHGYSGLKYTMHEHPGAFAHVPQGSKKGIVDKKLVLAEQLAKKHGKLPNRKWLVTHSYSGLDSVMHKHPGAFGHIPQLHLDSHQRPQ